MLQPSVTSSLGGSRGVNLDKAQDYTNHQSNHNDNLGSLTAALHKGKSMPSLRWDYKIMIKPITMLAVWEYHCCNQLLNIFSIWGKVSLLQTIAVVLEGPGLRMNFFLLRLTPSLRGNPCHNTNHFLLIHINQPGS